MMDRDIVLKGTFTSLPTAPKQLMHLVESGQTSLEPLNTQVACFEELTSAIELAAKHSGAMEAMALTVAST